MAVRGGLLSVDAACSRYRLSREEYLAWQRAFDHFGMRGLSGKGEQELQRMRKADRAAPNLPKLQTSDVGSSLVHRDTSQYKRPKVAQGQ
jgi:Protein of unknown function (DUF1153)